MKLIMLIDQRGSNDGINVKKFNKGVVYSTPYQISVSLYKVFIREGWATVYDDKVLEPLIEDKKIEPIKETKKIVKKKVVRRKTNNKTS